LKCRRKHQARIVSSPRSTVQAFENRESHGHGDEWPQKIRGWNHKADATHAITVLKGKQYTVVIFGGPLAVSVQVIDNEWEGM